MKSRIQLFRRQFTRNACLVALAITGCPATPSAAAETFIVQDGQPCAEIVISEQPARMTRLAAAELQAYVAKISDAVLPIVTAPADPSAVAIYVGRSDATDHLGYSEDGLDRGAYRMAAGDQYLVLLGRDRDFTPPPSYTDADWDRLTGEHWVYPYRALRQEYNREMDLWAFDERGSLNAVYAFLRDLGVRWYLPGESGEIVPRRDTILLPRVDRTVHPDFVYRNVVMQGRSFGGNRVTRDDVLWLLRLGVSQAPEVIGELSPALFHGTMNVLNRPEVKAAHPEWYPLIAGERFTAQRGFPCLSSAAFLSNQVKYVRFLFDQFGAPMVSLMPGAGEGILCECDGCKDQGSPELGWQGQTSDYVWSFVDRVAREVYKTHPDRRVSCNAYNTFVLPPSRVETFSPNVVVCIRQWRARLFEGSQGPHSRAAHQAIREGWLSKLPGGEGSLVIWESSHSARPSVPAIYPRMIARELCALKGASLGDWLEVYREPGGHGGLALNHLNIYVTARLWWDADLDVDRLLSEYLELYYGPAAEEMRSLLDVLETHPMRMATDRLAIDEFRRRLARARARVPADSVYAKRMALIEAEYDQPLRDLHARLGEPRAEGPRAWGPVLRGLEPRMDGILDEAFWQQAPVFRLENMRPDGATDCDTAFRMVWDADAHALLVGLVCQEPDIATLNIRARRDGDPKLFDGDAVELLLETQNHAYYQLAIDPAGALFDMDRAHGMESRWNSGASVAAHVGTNTWSLEIHIPVLDSERTKHDPLRGVVGGIPTDGEPWRMNIVRQRIRKTGVQVAAFAHARGYHDVNSFGLFTSGEQRERPLSLNCGPPHSGGPTLLHSTSDAMRGTTRFSIHEESDLAQRSD